MNLARFQDTLSRLCPKIETFAATLNDDERDVFAALLELSALGAQEGKHGYSSEVLVEISQDFSGNSAALLAALPQRVHQATS